MFSRKRAAATTYELELQELNQTQLLQQILLTLERMEVLLQSIDGKIGLHAEQQEKIADIIANGIDHNTEKLSEIDPIPDPEPKS